MQIRQRGVCPVCGESVGVRKDGMIRSHGYLKEVGQTTPCAGTGKEPRTTTEGAFSALCLADECNEPTQAIVWTGKSWDSMCGLHATRTLDSTLFDTPKEST